MSNNCGSVNCFGPFFVCSSTDICLPNVGAIAGIAIGCLVALILLIVGCCACCCCACCAGCSCNKHNRNKHAVSVM